MCQALGLHRFGLALNLEDMLDVYSEYLPNTTLDRNGWTNRVKEIEQAQPDDAADIV